jgi:hypothetical protein
MVATRAQKRSAADSRNPLQQAGILLRVLDYVGPGHWCFVAEVSSLWRELYSKVTSSSAFRFTGSEDSFYSIPQVTLMSVMVSISRVRFAHAHGLDCATVTYERAAGMHADIATLAAAHELGMSYSEASVEGAARRNKLAVVQFLCAQGCPLSASVYNAAAGRGDIDMCAYLHSEHCPWSDFTCVTAVVNGYSDTLRWLHEHGCEWHADLIHLAAAWSGSVDTMVCLQQQGLVLTAEMLTDMLNTAGAENKLAAAQWLRQQGAEWPAVLRHCNQWPDNTLLWARAEGCTSPTQ